MKKPRVSGPAQPDIVRLLAEARQLFSLGRIDRAEAVLQKVLQQSPNEKEALVALGIIASQTGRLEQAIAWMSRAVELDARSLTALNWLSSFLLQADHLDSAKSYAMQAVTVDPRNAAAHAILARCLARQRMYGEAIPHFQKAIELEPNNPTLFVEFSDALAAANLWMEARDALRKAVLLAPNSRDMLRLANLELRYGSIEDAERYCRRALGKGHDVAPAHILMARILTEQLMLDEAEPHWQRAAELDPQPGTVDRERALSLTAIGQFDGAILALRRSIEIQPCQGDAYRAFVYAKRIDPEDLPLVHQIEELVAKDLVSSGERLNLLYALGKSYDNLREYEKAIGFFDEANRLNRRLGGDRPFDRSALAEVIDAKIELFSKECFANWKSSRSDSSLPILIVGMMRSGTTLAEQMLSCHPKIGGAGEQDYWIAHEASMLDFANHTIDPAKLRSCGVDYANLLASIAPGFPHVIDKNPANLQVLGSIHLAFPNVRIIHTRRNPIDTALSIWMTPINTTAEFVGDRENIVFAYKEYLRLMDHWRKVLPKDRFMEVQYENLVDQPEVHARRILDFLGLAWDKACLHPEQNERRVRTPSMWQVRQPIYKSSTQRRENYKPWLGAFEELRALE